jgi:protein-disulfide isomerase
MKMDRRSVIFAGALGGLALLGGSALNAVVGVTAARADASAEALKAPSPLGDIALGAEDAPVTIVEYLSLGCPHCAAFAAETLPKLKEKYIDTGKVRLIMRELPFDDAVLAATMIVRCAPQEKAVPMIEMLLEQQDAWHSPGVDVRGELFKIARLAGLTQAQFDACLMNEDLARKIFEVTKQAKEFGVQSTPTFFVNGKKIVGAANIEEFDKVIAEAAQ